LEPFELPVSRSDHPLSYGSGILRGRWRSQFFVFHGGNLDVNIDAIQQRP